MKKYSTLIAAAVLALLLAGGMSARIYLQRKQFDATVHKALTVSEGYDKDFINMVNRLEVELATRASFGYTGGKDPMTGKIRRVARRIFSTKKTVPLIPAETADPFKLTAIIFDDAQKKYTAIVMKGERSFAVDVGDKVGDRNIQKITSERVFMTSDSLIYYYDISGKAGKRSKYRQPAETKKEE